MPVRRKTNRRRMSATIDAWAVYLECGVDFFDDLVDAGIVSRGREKPTDEAALAPWLTFSEELMHRWKTGRHPEQGEPWALTEFGPPIQKRRPGR